MCSVISNKFGCEFPQNHVVLPAYPTETAPYFNQGMLFSSSKAWRTIVYFLANMKSYSLAPFQSGVKNITTIHVICIGTLSTASMGPNMTPPRMPKMPKVKPPTAHAIEPPRALWTNMPVGDKYSVSAPQKTAVAQNWARLYMGRIARRYTTAWLRIFLNPNFFSNSSPRFAFLCRLRNVPAGLSHPIQRSH